MAIYLVININSYLTINMTIYLSWKGSKMTAGGFKGVVWKKSGLLVVTIVAA